MSFGHFAGGLAQGISNGMQMVDMYNRIKEQDDKRKKEEALLEADNNAARAGLETLEGGVPAGQVMPAGQALAASPSPAPPALQAAVPVNEPAHAYPVQESRSVPALSPGLQSATVAGEAKKAPGAGRQNAGSLNQPGQPEPADRLSVQADALTASMRQYMKSGHYIQAMQTLMQREKLNNEADGQRRQGALAQALSQFEASGNPNALVPYYNRYVSGSQELTGITRAADTADGQAVYLVHGIDHDSGKSFANPLSAHQLRQMAQAVADPSIHKKLIVQQAESLIKRQEERSKQQSGADREIRIFNATEPVRQRHKLEQISAQGEQARRNQSSAAEPAVVRTANWLIENGVAKDANEAWDEVNRLKNKPRSDAIRDLATGLLKANNDPLASEKITWQQAVEQAAQMYTSLEQAGHFAQNDTGQRGQTSPESSTGWDPDSLSGEADEAAQDALNHFLGAGQAEQEPPPDVPTLHKDFQRHDPRYDPGWKPQIYR